MILNLISHKGAKLGPMVLLNMNRKSYIRSLMETLDLTLNDREKSKSRSLTFWVVGDLYGIEIIWPAVYCNLNLDVTTESLLVGGVFCCPSGLSCLMYCAY